jgi:hypothetical protein
MKKVELVLCAATIAMMLAACSSDKTDDKTGSVSSGGSGGSAGSSRAGSGGRSASAGSGGSTGTIKSGYTTDAAKGDFDACYAQVQDHCVSKEMNTAEKMEIPCKELELIPVPLSAGGMYGPKTLKAGPYGGKIDWNQGKDTEFVNAVNSSEPVCVPIGIETFMEPASVNAEIENLRDVDYSLYTVFRPACMKPGEKYPVITWANGTCGEISGYSALLSTLASYGYVVIASNSTWTATAPTDKVQARAIDYAEALNKDENSILYQRLDLDHVGAAGHSQGASATGNVDGDARVKSVIFWNAGTSNEKPFLNVSGERDVRPSSPETMASGADAATQPGAWVFFHKVLETGGSSTGHLVLMEQADRVNDLNLAWWDWQLKGDQEAKKKFVGDPCTFCTMKDEFEYGHNSKLE